MKLIVGLGNPGQKYKNTRHNLGAMVVDLYAKNNGLAWRYSQDWLGFYAKANEFVLLKPSTFMNKSGECIRPAKEFYKIENSDILVIHDDLDLPLGKLRISFDSGSAGHHGVESTIASLGGMGFARLRVGIDHPSRKASADTKVLADKADDESETKEQVDSYVLSEFNAEEAKMIPKILIKCLEAVDSYVEGGIDATKNTFS